jgi:hypothetical protein
MSTLAAEFALALATRLKALPHGSADLPPATLALRLVEAIGHGDAVDVGVWAMLLHKHRFDVDGLATLALRPLLDVIRQETSQLERSAREAQMAEPYGYWLDGEWYGYTPQETALRVGERRTLTPVWTLNQGVTFIGTAADDGSDEVIAKPESEEDALGLRQFLRAEG